jgi:serine protease Do
VGRGALITQLGTGGPADAAGLKAGDVITAVNDEQVDGAPDCLRALQEQGIGAQITLTYYRGNSEYKASVTLGQSH